MEFFWPCKEDGLTFRLTPMAMAKKACGGASVLAMSKLDSFEFELNCSKKVEI